MSANELVLNETHAGRFYSAAGGEHGCSSVASRHGRLIESDAIHLIAMHLESPAELHQVFTLHDSTPHKQNNYPFGWLFVTNCKM